MKKVDLRQKRDFNGLAEFLRETINVLEQYDLAHVPYIGIAEDGREIAGMCVPDKKLIIINKNLYPHELKKTLMHEITHAVDFINDGHTSERRTDKRTNYLYKQLYG